MASGTRGGSRTDPAKNWVGGGADDHGGMGIRGYREDVKSRGGGC